MICLNKKISNLYNYNYIKQIKSLLEKIDVNINSNNQTAKFKFNKKKS